MKRFRNNSIIGVIAVLVLVLFVSSSATFAQEKKADDAEKKYAPIVGTYEFDLTELAMENQIVEFIVESDALWIDSGDGDPGELEPVEDEEFEFSIDDPDQGTLIFKFVKDEEGKYNQVIATVEMMGIDITGNRIDDGQ